MIRTLNIKFQFLLIATFFISALSLKAQQTIVDEIYTKDGIPKTRPYFDVELGILSLGNDGFGVLGVADINAGIALKNNIGFGLSYIGWNALSSCCATNASGVGVQLRIKSHKRLIFKLEMGYILNAYYGDDGPYRFEYNYEKSNKLYFRLSPTLRFGNFTTGLTWVSTKGQINDNFDYKSGAFIGKQPFTVSSLSLAIGFTIPK